MVRIVSLLLTGFQRNVPIVVVGYKKLKNVIPVLNIHYVYPSRSGFHGYVNRFKDDYYLKSKLYVLKRH